MNILTILLTIISFAFVTNTETRKPIIIYQNKGVDNLEFCKSKRRDVLKQYEKFKFQSSTSSVRHCWSDDKPPKDWEVLYNKTAGLSFSLGCNDLLSEITISNKNCEFDNGIRIGKSTKKDIINAFRIDQSVVDSFGELYIKIENENFKTEFEFRNNHILEEVTIKKIK